MNSYLIISILRTERIIKISLTSNQKCLEHLVNPYPSSRKRKSCSVVPKSANKLTGSSKLSVLRNKNINNCHIAIDCTSFNCYNTYFRFPLLKRNRTFFCLKVNVAVCHRFQQICSSCHSFISRTSLSSTSLWLCYILYTVLHT
jgi:hypothetical protein